MCRFVGRLLITYTTVRSEMNKTYTTVRSEIIGCISRVMIDESCYLTIHRGINIGLLCDDCYGVVISNLRFCVNDYQKVTRTIQEDEN